MFMSQIGSITAFTDKSFMFLKNPEMTIKV
jgi:hypothetical protein